MASTATMPSAAVSPDERFDDRTGRGRELAQLDAAIGSGDGNAADAGLRGVAKRDPGSFKEDMDDLDEAVRLAPDDPEVYIDRGLALDAMCLDEAAEADFSKAIKLDPHSPAYILRAKSRMLMGMYRQAIGDVEKIMRMIPDDGGDEVGRAMRGEALTMRGHCHNGLGKHWRAVRDLDQAVERCPESFQAYYFRGLAKEDMGRMEEALADYDEAIRLDPEITDPRMRRGVLHLKAGRMEEALADFSATVGPGDGEDGGVLPLILRGKALGELGRHDEALADLDEAVRIDPGRWSTYLARGFEKGLQRRYEEALADLDMAVGMEPGNPLLHYIRGNCNSDLGRPGEAAGDYREAIRLAEHGDSWRDICERAKADLAELSL